MCTSEDEDRPTRINPLNLQSQLEGMHGLHAPNVVREVTCSQLSATSVSMIP